jgi:RNA recognition motif-containing protein
VRLIAGAPRVHRRSRRSRSPLRRPETGKLHVSKLTRNVNSAHLEEIFGHFGKVTAAEVAMDRTVCPHR